MGHPEILGGVPQREAGGRELGGERSGGVLCLPLKFLCLRSSALDLCGTLLDEGTPSMRISIATWKVSMGFPVTRLATSRPASSTDEIVRACVA